MQVPLLDLKAQYETLRAEIDAAIADVCESQLFALGPAVTEFERDIAQYLDCKFAIGVSSGTDALLTALMALDIKGGDEVITTPFTFFATAGSIARLGATPVFVDIEEDSFNVNPDLIEKKLTEKTRAIIPVHLFGQAARMGPIRKIAKQHNLAVIEDACQAIGAERSGVKCGSLGDLGCFSFYPTKNLSAFGDAGLVTTGDAVLAEKIKLLRHHGQATPYEYTIVGGNFRLDSIQAAVLSVKLKYLDQWNRRRRQLARLYDKIFAGSAVRTPEIDPENDSVYHQYTVKVAKRDNLRNFLAQNQVGSAVFYPKPLHLQPCFAYLGYKQNDLPVAEKLCSQVLSLPIYPELKDEQVEFVAKTVLEFYEAC